MNRFRQSLAIALRVFDYSETSQVVQLYSRELGRVHAIAKGSKRRRSAFHGAFDVLSLYDIQRLEKQPGTLDLLTAAETLEDFRRVRADFTRFSAASYCADLVAEATQEGMPQPDLFDALRAALASLDAGDPLPDTVFRFEAILLHVLGHFPRLQPCGSCGRPLSGPEAWFSVRDGGVLCVHCPPRDPVRMMVKRIVIDALAAFHKGKAFNLSVYPQLTDDLRRLLDMHIRGVLDREPKSARFMRAALLSGISTPSPARPSR